MNKGLEACFLYVKPCFQTELTSKKIQNLGPRDHDKGRFGRVSSHVLCFASFTLKNELHDCILL